MEKNSSLFSDAYLRSLWAEEYENYEDSGKDAELLALIRNWNAKERQHETAAEGAFIHVFFESMWGYVSSGRNDASEGYTLQQQFSVRGAGQTGGTGRADIALGYFGLDTEAPIPQVLGEFKDDRSGLDKPQVNRPNRMSPVDQCLKYLQEARAGLISPILPAWGVVTDMNEFRLYHFGNKAQYQRFVIAPNAGDILHPLLEDSEQARFQRFLFSRMFHRDYLLTRGGKSRLEKLLEDQIVQEQALENEFYLEYHAYRDRLYQTLCACNPKYGEQKRLRHLVRYTQRILDRCLFILYCEDMGRELRFPPNVLRDALIEISNSRFYDPDGREAWTTIKRLFDAMRDGTPFGRERINRFNGGLFEVDPELEALEIPNSVFCACNQGQSRERLLEDKKTLLYFSAKYNFGHGVEGGERTLTLTAMGRIFEQSITELEVMEAKAEGRESLTEITRRKRDGVYYTPEWVTHYIVEETVGARLAEIREELGFHRFEDLTDADIEEFRNDKRKSRSVGQYGAALLQYQQRLETLKVVDPACGSGAFLIQAFRYLYEQRQWVTREMDRLTGTPGLFDSHDVMRSVVSKNLYGVDINPESVEITRLALWLYTAVPDKPLTALDKNIRCGNSLIGHDFYKQMGISRELFGEDDRGRVNTFDWAEAFPEIFEGDDPGFDCVIGNPPYVKLQHFRRVQADVAEYLVNARRPDGTPMYESTQTGNFDMYLPFIERGIELLNRNGKMGYIAPNVWMVNDYGRGLRQKLKRTRRLERWVDFKSYQVFKEAITYTAIQLFCGSSVKAINCLLITDEKNTVLKSNWNQVNNKIFYSELDSDESWIMIPHDERRLLNRIMLSFPNLSDEKLTDHIFQGLVTSADYIFHLERLGKNKYLHNPKGYKEPEEFEIEDEIMHPLVSGKDVQRYQVPITKTFLLFPYITSDNGRRLATANEMISIFPNAWNYLKRFEMQLRQRENGKMDIDDKWWGFVYPKNLDRHDSSKLELVPRTKSH